MVQNGRYILPMGLLQPAPAKVLLRPGDLAQQTFAIFVLHFCLQHGLYFDVVKSHSGSAICVAISWALISCRHLLIRLYTYSFFSTSMQLFFSQQHTLTPCSIERSRMCEYVREDLIAQHHGTLTPHNQVSLCECVREEFMA